MVDEEVEVLLPSDANASSNNVREIGDDKHVKDRRVDLQCLDMHGSLLFRLLFLPSALLCCRRSRCSLTDGFKLYSVGGLYLLSDGSTLDVQLQRCGGEGSEQNHCEDCDGRCIGDRIEVFKCL